MFATLEIELPENCAGCPLLAVEGDLAFCCGSRRMIQNTHNKYEGRAPDCPLKIMPVCAQSIRRTVAAGEEKCIGKKYWVSVSAPTLIVEEGGSCPVCQKCEGNKGVEYAEN